MRWSDFLQTWDGHETENRLSRVIIIGLLVVCVITSLAALRTERSIILVPPISQLKALFRDLGLQKTPSGYSLREPKPQEQIRCLQDRVQIKTGQVLEGQDRLIMVGLAKNTGSDLLEFDERSCATTQQDALAVSVWPNVVLKPQEATELYVVVRQSPEASVSLRPSLLSGGQP